LPGAPTSAAGSATRWRIEIHLPVLSEFFNALDPSPLVGRDVDDRVEEFIVETARDAPAGTEFELIISARHAEREKIDPEEVGAAVRAYFAYLRDAQLKRVRRLLRDGRQALVLGAGFLAVCTGLGQLARTLAPGPVGQFLVEGLLIIGWVANWRPVEIFLYDWRPMRTLALLYDRLSRMSVVVQEADQTSPAPQAA
jgi:hypothetical protein